MKAAVGGVKNILNTLNPNDMVAIITFNNTVNDLSGGIVECTAENKRLLSQKLDRVKASGGTVLYDAALATTNLVLKISEEAKKRGQLARLVGQLAGVAEDGDMGHFHMVILTDGMDSREDTGSNPGSQHSVEETAILLGLLGAAGVEYNTHWIGVLLNSEAEQKLGALTRVGGEKSSYARCQDHSEIASKFQEIAIKIVQRPEAAAAAALASALASAAGAQPGQISGPRTAYAGSIQQGSHVEITNATHGWGSVKCGDRGVVQRKDGNGRFVVNFIAQDNFTVASTDIKLDPVAEKVRKGARVKVKPGVTPRRQWGFASAQSSGLVREVKADGACVVDFGGNALWQSEIGELVAIPDEPHFGHLPGPFQIGNCVRVADEVVTPSRQWGSVTRENSPYGYITDKTPDGGYKVNFPAKDGWVCSAEDLEIAAVKDKIRPGVSVHVVVDNPQGGWAGVSKSSVGVVRSSKHDASIVEVDFPEKLGWKCRLTEIDLCDAVVELD